MEEETKEQGNVTLNNAVDEGAVMDVQQKEVEQQETKKAPGVDPRVDPHLDPISNGVKAGVKAYNDTMAAGQRKPRYDEDQMKPILETLKDKGVDLKKLQESGDLKRMQQGMYTTNLYQYTFTAADGTEITQKGKLSVMNGADGNLKLYTMPVVRLKAKTLEEHLAVVPYYGYQFSQEEIKALILTGNAGHPIMIDKSIGTDNATEPTPHLVSIDKLTNQLRAVPVDKVRKFSKFLDVELNEAQQQQLREGKPLRVTYTFERQDRESGEKIQVKNTAYIQYNAVNMRLETLPATIFTPKHLMGHELTDEERYKLTMGQTIVIDNAVDKKGQTYTAYVNISDDGKLRFSDANGRPLFKNNQNQAKPTDDFKEQVALNNEGHKTDAVKQSGKETLAAGEKPKPKQEVGKPKLNPKAPVVGKPKLKSSGPKM